MRSKLRTDRLFLIHERLRIGVIGGGNKSGNKFGNKLKGKPDGAKFFCNKKVLILLGKSRPIWSEWRDSNSRPLEPGSKQEAMLLTAWLPALRGLCTVVRSGAKGIARYEAGDGIVVRMSTKEHQQPKLSRSSSRSSSSGSSLWMEEEAIGGTTMISAFSRSPS